MNLPLPPRWVRRILIAPLVVLLALGAFLYVPIVLLLAAVFAYKLPGKLRALRLAGFALVYLGIELVEAALPRLRDRPLRAAALGTEPALRRRAAVVRPQGRG